MLHKYRKYVQDCIGAAVSYRKGRYKHGKAPVLQRGDQVLIFTINVNNIQGSRNLKDAYIGPFFVEKIHGTNAVK